MQLTIKAEMIDGEAYYTVSQIAAITKRSDQSVYKLINRGNAIRKMRSRKIAGRVLVPASEVTKFPFTGIGAGSEERIYHYNTEGEIVEDVNSDETPESSIVS